MANQGLQIYLRIQGLDPKEHDLPQNPFDKGTINKLISYEIRRIYHPIDQPEVLVETIEEVSMPPTNPSFTGPYNPLLIEFPSTRYIDNFSSDHFPPDMYIR